MSNPEAYLPEAYLAESFLGDKEESSELKERVRYWLGRFTPLRTLVNNKRRADLVCRQMTKEVLFSEQGSGRDTTFNYLVNIVLVKLLADGYRYKLYEHRSHRLPKYGRPVKVRYMRWQKDGKVMGAL